MFKAVIFDLDGTLVNSLDDLADSSNYALNKLGYPTHPVEAYKYFVGDGVAKLMQRILPKEKTTPEEVEKILNIYSSYYVEHCFDKSKPYEGIPELLYALKNKGYILAVISNKVDAQTQTIISTFFKEGLFDVIAGHRIGYAPKPDPSLTLDIIAQIGLKSEECVFVGDTGMDILTGVNSGAFPIGVTWGFRLKEELIANGAKYIVDKPSEILEFLAKTNIK